MGSTDRFPRTLPVLVTAGALSMCCMGGPVAGGSPPERLWQVRLDVDERDDRATVAEFFRRHVVAGGFSRVRRENGGGQVTWMMQWNAATGAPRWSRTVEGIAVPVALATDRKRLFLAGYGRRPLQALRGRDGKPLWQVARGPDLLSLAWLDVELAGRVLYAAGREDVEAGPDRGVIEARRARDGKVLWTVREDIDGPGTPAAPLLALDGTRVVSAGTGVVSARRREDGEELWRVRDPELVQPASLELAGDRVLVLHRASEGALGIDALDASSGRFLWSLRLGAGFPTIYQPGGAFVSGSVLVVAIDVVGGQGRPNDLLFLGLRIEDGSEVWSERIPGDYPSGNAGVVPYGSTVVAGGVRFRPGGVAERILRGYGRASGGLHWELLDGPSWVSASAVRSDRLLVAGSVLESPTDALVRLYSLPAD